MEKGKEILIKSLSVYLFVLIIGLLVVYKILVIQIKEGEIWKNISQQYTLISQTQKASRGNIYTMDKKILATSVPVYNVGVCFNSKAFIEANSDKKRLSKDIDSLAEQLSLLFGDKSKKEYKALLKSFLKNKKSYNVLKKNVDEAQLKKLKGFPIFRKGRYKGGLVYDEYSKRIYPFEILARRTVGITRNCKDCKQIGIESALNYVLEGKDGKLIKQRLSGGQLVTINSSENVEPEDGYDVITTIDINYQDVAEYALYRQLKKSKARSGCVVLMETETGYIKAIANLERKADDTIYYESYNYAIGQSVEPGSTFKLASVIVALEDGYAKLNDVVPTGEITYGKQIMKDAHYEGQNRMVSLKEAFAISSNVGISSMVYRNYSKQPQKFVEGLYRLGLGRKLNIDIAGEADPYIKNTKDKTWSSVSLPWMSVGYELSITPLQMLTFYNAVANNGKMVKPLFIKEILKTGKVVESYEPFVIEDQICSKKTIDMVKELLIEVVENGTARNIRNDIYKIAGKTGTAQIAKNREGYKKDKIEYRASFVGFFPADNPKYSCIVVINNPESVYYGSAVAAPVFKEIADKVYSSRIDIHDPVQRKIIAKKNEQPYIKKGIVKDDIVYIAKNIDINYMQTNIGMLYSSSAIKKFNYMPDLTGMNVRDALYLTENSGLIVSVEGSGEVFYQSIPVGTKISKGQNLLIKLR